MITVLRSVGGINVPSFHIKALMLLLIRLVVTFELYISPNSMLGMASILPRKAAFSFLQRDTSLSFSFNVHLTPFFFC